MLKRFIGEAKQWYNFEQWIEITITTKITITMTYKSILLYSSCLVQFISYDDRDCSCCILSRS